MNRYLFIPCILFLLLSACGPFSPGATATPSPFPATPTPAASPTPLGAVMPENCHPVPVIVPTLPAKIPGYTELDPTTNLHYTGTYQQISPVDYRLVVSGKVDHPLSLTYDQIRCMPKITEKETLICPGYFEDYATWGGVSLGYILDLAGVQADATQLSLNAPDGKEAYADLEIARAPDAILAYEWESQPLPILHGFPLRAIFPGHYGSYWVKWLTEIIVK